MFEIDLNVDGNFIQTAEKLGATEAQVRIAAMRTINKTALWVQSKSAKEISSQKKILLKLVRQRLKVIKSNRQALKAFVMANLYGIKATKLGFPKQNSTGSSVGAHKFQGAFVAKMPKTGHVGIFKRKGRSRLPIQEQYVDLDPEATEIIEKNIENEARQVFQKHFDHEFEYVTATS